MPRGLYIIDEKSSPKVDDDVMVCLPSQLSNFALKRGYLKHGTCKGNVQPFIKKIIAVTNDQICLTKQNLLVNGKTLSDSATRDVDSNGTILPSVAREHYTLSKNQIWICGSNSTRSWDSRYFGAIDKKFIVHVVKPIITWR